MSSLYLPVYVPPRAGPSSAVASRASLDRTSRRALRKAVAGEGAIIPGAYGRVQAPAKVVTVTRQTNLRLLVLCVWLEGEIDAVEQIRIGDVVYTGDVAHYLGTPTQAPDPWLAGAISGYVDALANVAYSVLRIPNTIDINPRIEATLRGWRCYDPRTETTVWTQNAGLALAHFIVARTGRTVDWSSVADLADACDELLPDDRPRRHIGLVLDRPAPINDWIETLREYAGCYIVWDDPVRFVPSRPRAVDHVIGPDKIRDLRLRKARLDDTPNRVIVEYTRIDGNTWTIERAATPYPVGQVPREQILRMHGIQNYAQAMRHAVERLNHYTLADLRGDSILSDEALEVTAGDVLSMTHHIGLTNKAMRVIGDPIAIEPGRWQLALEEYDAAVYSDSIESEPSSPDTSLPDPLDVPAGPVPTLVEDVYQLQAGIFATRIRASWEATDYPYAHQYRITVTDSGGNLAWSGETRATSYVTGAIQEGVTYTVAVAVIGFGGVTGAPGSAAILAQGKFLPPGDVPQITAQQVAADAVKAVWEPAIDVDIYRYELRRGAVGVEWVDATVVDLVDGLQARIEGLAVGQHDLLIRALDSVRQYSPNVTRVTATVTAPSAPASVSAFEVGGEVRLAWPEVSGYVAAYALRYGPLEGDWDGATRLDRVQALRYVTKEIPAGTWRVYVRAVDTAGNLSPTAAAGTVTVTLDNESFLVGAITWSNPSLTNMASWSHRSLDNVPVTYVTDTGQTAAARYPNAMATYTDVLATYHVSATTEWETEAHDVGTLVSGTWQLSTGWEALSGTVTVELELSEDGISWDTYTQLSVQASARYARVRLTATGSSSLLVRQEDVVLRLDAVAREESGVILTGTSGAATVTLSNNYTAVQSITLTLEGSTPASVVYDNVQLGGPASFDVYAFSLAGSQVSRTVRWSFKGV